MRLLTHALALALGAAAIACGGDDDDDDAKCPPIGDGSVSGDGGTTTCKEKTFQQVEHLARPAINEALLITEAFNAGYNSTAPSFKGVDTATLGKVTDEAKTVLKALYLGACLLNGTIPTVTAQTGVHPAGMECHAIGPAIWTENALLTGVTLTEASKTAAQKYADKVFGQFEPDVMRVDTAVDSNYLTPCATAADSPLLCGGRFLREDVVDITYNYLLNGANPAITTGAGAALGQVSALLSDGVAFSADPAKNNGNTTPPDPTNKNQFHPDVSNTFPYSAAPF